MKQLFQKHWQMLVNILVSGLLTYGAAYRAVHAWTAEEFDWVEALFFGRNLVLVMIILARQDHVGINKNFLHQVIALIAFFSGIAFDERPATDSVLLDHLSKGIVAVALIMATVSLFNLGRSFGILISIRKIKTRGLYAIIRHPMFLTDILWRVGFTLGNPSVYNAALVIVSSAAYVYRALLEEKYLSQFPEYREYMQRVKYRLIPGVF